MFLPAETIEVKEQFRKHFGLRFSEFYDPWLTAGTGTVQIDIIKFSKWLFRTRPGNDELSFNAVLIKYYGQEAKEFIDKIS